MLGASAVTGVDSVEVVVGALLELSSFFSVVFGSSFWVDVAAAAVVAVAGALAFFTITTKNFFSSIL